jgi:type II secretory pathway pseudopilin PulG
MPLPVKACSKAIVSLILGILGLTCLGIFAGVPALILGILAMKEIRRSGGVLSGAGLAIAGIVLGICSLLIAVFMVFLITAIGFPNFLEAQVRSKVSRVRSDQRSLATALECYYVDNSCYPSCAAGGEGANCELPADSEACQLPTFRIWSQPWQQKEYSTLTTPVAYITSYFNDPFSDDPNATYIYYTDGQGWVLISPGPDGVYDIDPLEDYISTLSQPSPALLEKCYDPSNGTKSSGDIFRVKM